MHAITRWFRRQSSWLESQQASILSAAFIIVVANVASAISGYAKNRVIASVYINDRFGNLLDAYWAAFRLPDFVYQLVVLGVLSAAVVPLFAQLYKQKPGKAFNLANQAMTLLLSLMIVFCVVVWIWAPQFIGLFISPNVPARQFALTVDMTRIMLFSQILFAISGFFSAMLQGTKRFIVPAFTPVFYNLGIAAVVIVGTRWLGLYAAAWGTVFGASLHLLIQIPIIWRIGFRPRWPQWHRDELKELLTMTGPRAVTLVINQLNQFVVTYFATGLGALNLTMITFVQQLMLPPIRFFGVSIGQASLPFLATNHHDLEGFQRMVFRSLRQIAFFAAPSAVLLLVLRVPIVRLAYGTKDLPWRATLQMAEALGILSLSVGPQAITHLLIRAFYALNNTVTPLVVAVVYFLVSAVGGWYFVTQAGMGLRGIAISLSAAGTLEMFLLLLCLIYRVRAHNFAPHLWALLRITIASFVMAVTLFIFQRLFDLYVFETSRVLQLIQLTLLVTALGGTVYLGLCWLLKIEELLILKKLYNSLRFHWRKSTGATPEFVESISHAD